MTMKMAFIGLNPKSFMAGFCAMYGYITDLKDPVIRETYPDIRSYTKSIRIKSL